MEEILENLHQTSSKQIITDSLPSNSNIPSSSSDILQALKNKVDNFSFELKNQKEERFSKEIKEILLSYYYTVISIIHLLTFSNLFYLSDDFQEFCSFLLCGSWIRKRNYRLCFKGLVEYHLMKMEYLNCFVRNL